MNHQRHRSEHHRGLGLAVLVVAVLGALGCSATQTGNEGDYQTIGKQPRRNMEQAKQANDYAVELIQQQRYDEAEQALKDALEADVTFGPAHNNLGKVYYHQAKYYLAAWEFQYAIKLMPHQPQPRNNLGLVFEAVGKFDDAVTAYGKARSLQPDNPHFIGNLARVRLRRGDRGEELRSLLSDLLMRDTRSDWLQWAREKLSVLGHPTGEGR